MLPGQFSVAINSNANAFSAASETTINTGGTLDLGGFAQTVNTINLAGGTLTNGSLTGAILSSGGTISDITGLASLTTDGGNTIIVGNNSFSGAITVSGGRLAANSTLANAISVLSGGTLGGSGSVGSVTLASGAFIAPGNSIGTLTVTGDLTFAAGSTYQVEVDPAGAVSDLIVVTGTAMLNDASVVHIGEAGTYRANATYTILTAAGGLVGTFGPLSSNFAFLSPTLGYSTNAVTMTLTRNMAVSFSDVAFTQNQRAAAAGVESLASGNRIYDAVVGLDAATARSAFDQLSGEVYASTTSVLVEDSKFVRDALSNRLYEAFGDNTSSDVAIWGQTFGGWHAAGGDPGIAALQRDVGGLVTGVDGEIFDTWRLGVMGGYSQSSLSIPERASSAHINNYHLGIYGSAQWNAASLRAGIAHSWSDISSRRSVGFSNFADQLTADGHAGTFQAFGELGYRFDLDDAYIEPFANLAHVSVRTDALTENGGAAALSIRGDSMDTTFTTLGLRSSAEFDIGTTSVTARGLLGWRHAFGDTTPSATNRFAGSNAFTVTGTAVASDVAIIEAGLELSMSDAASLGIAYAGQFGSGIKDNGVTARFVAKF